MLFHAFAQNLMKTFDADNVVLTNECIIQFIFLIDKCSTLSILKHVGSHSELSAMVCDEQICPKCHYAPSQCKQLRFTAEALVCITYQLLSTAGFFQKILGNSFCWLSANRPFRIAVIFIFELVKFVRCLLFCAYLNLC
jgi:hypothetical protein